MKSLNLIGNIKVFTTGRALIWLLPAALTACLFYAVGSRPEDPELRRLGPTYVLQFLGEPRYWLVLLAALVAPLPGGAASWLRRPDRRRGDLSGLAASIVARVFAIQMSVFLFLSFINAATQEYFLIAQVLVLFSGALRLGGVDVTGGESTTPEMVSGQRRRYYRCYSVIMLVLCALGLLSVQFGQDGNWDLWNYHYYNAHHVLHGRINHDFGVAFIQTYFNPTLDVPVYFLIRSVPPMWVGFVLGAFHGGAVVMLFAVAHRVIGLIEGYDRVQLPLAVAVALCGMIEPMFLVQFGTTTHENFMSMMVLASILGIVGLAREGQGRLNGRSVRVLLGCGLCVGAAVGIKLTVTHYLVGSVFALILISRKWRRNLAAATTFTLGATLGILMTGGYWMLILYKKFGNPLFPFFNNWFRSPYWTSEDFSQKAADHLSCPTTWWNYLLCPFYFARMTKYCSETISRDPRLGVLYALLLIVPVVVVGRKLLTRWRVLRRSDASEPTGPPPRVVAFLVTFTVASYVVWYKFCVLRYLVTLKLLVPLLCFLMVLFIFGAARRARVLLATSLIFLLTSASITIPGYLHIGWSESFLGIKVPEFGAKERGVVLMVSSTPTGFLPIGFVAAEFPRRMRMINLDSQTIQHGSGQTLRMKEEVKRLIEQYRGHFYVLGSQESVRFARAVLPEYGLTVRDANPRPVATRRGDLQLWRVERDMRVAAGAGQAVK